MWYQTTWRYGWGGSDIELRTVMQRRVWNSTLGRGGCSGQDTGCDTEGTCHISKFKEMNWKCKGITVILFFTYQNLLPYSQKYNYNNVDIITFARRQRGNNIA